jgi:hypothetical protein
MIVPLSRDRRPSRTKVIKTAFGQLGSDLYAHIGGVAHQATWALAAWTSVTTDNHGAHSITDQAEADHLDLACNVAQLLATASTSLSGYWGRDNTALAIATFQVAADTREGATPERLVQTRFGGDRAGRG